MLNIKWKNGVSSLLITSFVPVSTAMCMELSSSKDAEIKDDEIIDIKKKFPEKIKEYGKNINNFFKTENFWINLLNVEDFRPIALDIIGEEDGIKYLFSEYAITWIKEHLRHLKRIKEERGLLAAGKEISFVIKILPSLSVSDFDEVCEDIRKSMKKKIEEVQGFASVYSNDGKDLVTKFIEHDGKYLIDGTLKANDAKDYLFWKDNFKEKFKKRVTEEMVKKNLDVCRAVGLNKDVARAFLVGICIKSLEKYCEEFDKIDRFHPEDFLCKIREVVSCSYGVGRFWPNNFLPDDFWKRIILRTGKFLANKEAAYVFGDDDSLRERFIEKILSVKNFGGLSDRDLISLVNRIRYGKGCDSLCDSIFVSEDIRKDLTKLKEILKSSEVFVSSEIIKELENLIKSKGRNPRSHFVKSDVERVIRLLHYEVQLMKNRKDKILSWLGRFAVSDDDGTLKIVPDDLLENRVIGEVCFVYREIANDIIVALNEYEQIKESLKDFWEHVDLDYESKFKEKFDKFSVKERREYYEKHPIMKKDEALKKLKDLVEKIKQNEEFKKDRVIKILEKTIENIDEDIESKKLKFCNAVNLLEVMVGIVDPKILHPFLCGIKDEEKMCCDAKKCREAEGLVNNLRIFIERVKCETVQDCRDVIEHIVAGNKEEVFLMEFCKVLAKLRLDRLKKVLNRPEKVHRKFIFNDSLKKVKSTIVKSKEEPREDVKPILAIEDLDSMDLFPDVFVCLQNLAIFKKNFCDKYRFSKEYDRYGFSEEYDKYCSPNTCDEFF